MRQTLTIRDWVPDQITNGTGKGRWAAIKAKKAAKVMAWASARQAQWQYQAGRVRLTVVYVFPVKRSRDVDNLYARSVGLVNGLKGDFFMDDNSDVLDLRVTARTEKGVKATEITLESLDDMALAAGRSDAAEDVEGK